MSDLGLFWDMDSMAADFAISANDLAADDGLETSVLLSLFTDRDAEPGDVLPTADTHHRGWWGDVVPVVPGDKFGSRLWELAREKDTAEVLRRAPVLANEALAWMLEDKVAQSVNVTAESLPVESGRSMLALGVDITRPSGDTVAFRYHYNWASQEARRA